MLVFPVKENARMRARDIDKGSLWKGSFFLVVYAQGKQARQTLLLLLASYLCLDVYMYVYMSLDLIEIRTEEHLFMKDCLFLLLTF